MGIKVCQVCDEPILKDEPRITVSGQSIHEYCDLSENASGPCDESGCQWRWCYHAGQHVV